MGTERFDLTIQAEWELAAHVSWSRGYFYWVFQAHYGEDARD